LPDINARREPDIEALAKKAGVNVETARKIVSKAMNKIKEMRKPQTQ
jgi:Holliday junction resolvasome RuvABC DNA-binding subunit